MTTPSFDVDLDIDWEAPWRFDLYAMPPERVTLFGSRIWSAMSEAERRERAVHEAASLLSCGAHLITMLVAPQLRRVSEAGLNTPAAREALTEIAGSTRAAVLFGRLVRAAGVAPVPLPRGTAEAVKFLAFAPLGASSFGAALLLERSLVGAFGTVVGDDRVEPHVRQAFRLYALESGHRLDFARRRVRESMDGASPFVRAYHRLLLAVVAVVVSRLLYTPTIAPARWRTRRAAARGRRLLRRTAAEEPVDFLRSAGMLDGRVTGWLWGRTDMVEKRTSGSGTPYERTQRTNDGTRGQLSR